MKRTILVACMMAIALGCAGSADDGEVPVASADAGSPVQAPADAGVPDAAPEPLTTCCRLDNERGERLDYKCGATGTAISAAWFESRGYRCWLVQ